MQESGEPEILAASRNKDFEHVASEYIEKLHRYQVSDLRQCPSFGAEKDSNDLTHGVPFSLLAQNEVIWTMPMSRSPAYKCRLKTNVT
jgi:hypothetical protein